MPSRTTTQYKNSLQSIRLYMKLFTIANKEYLQTELSHLKLALQKKWTRQKRHNQNNQ